MGRPRAATEPPGPAGGGLREEGSHRFICPPPPPEPQLLARSQGPPNLTRCPPSSLTARAWFAFGQNNAATPSEKRAAPTAGARKPQFPAQAHPPRPLRRGRPRSFCFCTPARSPGRGSCRSPSGCCGPAPRAGARAHPPGTLPCASAGTRISVNALTTQLDGDGVKAAREAVVSVSVLPARSPLPTGRHAVYHG